MQTAWNRLRAAFHVVAGIGLLRLKRWEQARRRLALVQSLVAEPIIWVSILQGFADHELGAYESALTKGAEALDCLESSKGRWSAQERSYLAIYCRVLCRSAASRGGVSIHPLLMEKLRVVEPPNPPAVGSWLRDLFPLPPL
jgi:hypothetical protein